VTTKIRLFNSLWLDSTLQALRMSSCSVPFLHSERMHLICV
jgi:hypothetical protein